MKMVLRIQRIWKWYLKVSSQRDEPFPYNKPDVSASYNDIFDMQNPHFQKKRSFNLYLTWFWADWIRYC